MATLEPVRRPRHNAVIIGLDGLMLEYLDQYVADGHCPNLARLLRGGASADAYSAQPPATPVNWNTIATGCYTGGHGVHGMNYHTMGEPVTAAGVSSFNADWRTAEPLWTANERGGGTSLLLRYTCSWPPTLTRGVQVDGHGDPRTNLAQVSQRHCWATYPLPNPPTGRPYGLGPWAGPDGSIPWAYQVTLTTATWANLPADVTRTLEADCTLPLTRGGASQPLHALLVDRGQGFAEVRVNTGRDWQGSVSAGAGEWTGWLTIPVASDGRDGQAYLRFKVMELAADGARFKLYAPGAFPDRGWTVPDELCGSLVDSIGPYAETAGAGAAYRAGWTDIATFLEECEFQVDWLCAAARRLMWEVPWNLFMAQLHITDHVGHILMGHIDPESAYYRADLAAASAAGYRRTYELADRYVGAILEHTPDDATVVVVSDHGMYPIRLPVVDVNTVLREAGLQDPNGDPAQTKAAWYYESAIRINVRGRDEGGIVEPGSEYEAVRDQVIRALEDYRDDRTGERVFQLVMRVEDAAVFGWYGDRAGDIVYLQKPRLAGRGRGPGPGVYDDATPVKGWLPNTGEHHYLWQMAPRSDGSAPGGRAAFIMRAPGVRPGYRRPGAIELVDVAPTVSFVSGIPVPRHAEGRIRHDLFDGELF